jgi:hypothetical protein
MIHSPPCVLNEYDQVEWWDVGRRLNPDLTWEHFEADWDEFVRMKQATVRLASKTPAVSAQR